MFVNLFTNLLVVVLFFQVNPFVIVNVHSSKLVSARSVRPKKIHLCSNARLSKPITSSIARPSKLVIGSNVCSIKPVSVSSISPSKKINK